MGPSWRLSPLSNRCGFLNRSTTSADQPLCTENVSKTLYTENVSKMFLKPRTKKKKKRFQEHCTQTLSLAYRAHAENVSGLLCMENEPAHEIMALFILRKFILQTRMRSHPVELNVWCLVGPFAYFHTSCVRPAKVLARLRGCIGSPEPSLVAYVISTIIS